MEIATLIKKGCPPERNNPVKTQWPEQPNGKIKILYAEDEIKMEKPKRKTLPEIFEEAGENQVYYDMYMRGQYSRPEGKPDNLQTYHHHINNRMASIGLNVGMIQAHCVALVGIVQRDGSPEVIKMVNERIAQIEQACKGITLGETMFTGIMQGACVDSENQD